MSDTPCPTQLPLPPLLFKGGALGLKRGSCTWQPLASVEQADPIAVGGPFVDCVGGAASSSASSGFAPWKQPPSQLSAELALAGAPQHLGSSASLSSLPSSCAEDFGAPAILGCSCRWSDAICPAPGSEDACRAASSSCAATADTDSTIGRVLKWSQGSGFIAYYSSKSGRRKVYRSANAAGVGAFEKGDVVECVIRKSPSVPVADNVILLGQADPPAVLSLDTWEWPASQLEPHPSQVVIAIKDNLDAYKKTQSPPERLRNAANHYLKVVEDFNAQQELRFGTDLFQVGSWGDSDQLQRYAANYQEAWLEVKNWCSPPSVAALCEVHQVLARGDNRSSGTIRASDVRIGNARCIAYAEVPSALACYVRTLEKVMEREDLTACAKAAWAAHHLLVIHPFQDGNGRLARLLINWILRTAGVPFPILLCGTDDHRAGWREALVAGLRRNSNSQHLAKMVAEVLAYTWTELEAEVEKAEQSRLEVAQDQAVREARNRARDDSCAICFDTTPDMTVLCCGAIFHMSCVSRWLMTAHDPSCPACRAHMPVASARHASPRIPWDINSMRLLGGFDPQRQLRQDLEDWIRDGSDASEHSSSLDSLFHDSGDRCAFCDNTRAVGCVLNACRRCCMARPERCERHCPSAQPALMESRPPPLPGNWDPLRFVDASLAAANASDPGRVGPCAFCSTNQRARHCELGACRSCCLRRSGGACMWHAIGNGLVGVVGGSVPPPPQPFQLVHEICGMCGRNRRATSCPHNACRQCCLALARPCDRHRQGV